MSKEAEEERVQNDLLQKLYNCYESTDNDTATIIKEAIDWIEKQ
tara:strand:+ start:755 stop:886 length:132 start_codon:yes stop_codon:yes gene_type:complete